MKFIPIAVTRDSTSRTSYNYLERFEGPNVLRHIILINAAVGTRNRDP